MGRLGGLVIVLIICILAAALVLMRLQPAEQAATPTPQAQSASPELKTVTIYVAAQAIPIGTTITQDMLAMQPWPEHLMLPGFVGAEGGAQQVVGKVARAPFQQQEPIIANKLANPNDPNFLAGELPKGMRVITIMTNEIEGIAGFVAPGDHVDVLLTHDVKPDENAASTAVTETLLNNVTVVAVDQRAIGASMTDAQGNVAIPRSVSLMVSPTDAQRVRLGQKVGTLTLSLRSLADREASDPYTATSEDDISQHHGASAPLSRKGEVVIYRGAPSASSGAEDTAEMPSPAAMGSQSVPVTNNPPVSP